MQRKNGLLAGSISVMKKPLHTADVCFEKFSCFSTQKNLMGEGGVAEMSRLEADTLSQIFATNLQTWYWVNICIGLIYSFLLSIPLC